MIEITVDMNQSIYDLAIQEYGHVDGDSLLIQHNEDKINYNDLIPPGRKLLIDETAIIDPIVVKYLKNKGIKPSTAVKPIHYGGFSSGFSKGFNITK